MYKKKHPFSIPKTILIERLKKYLEIDIGFGDLSSGIIPENAQSKAKIIVKSNGILAGGEEATLLFENIGIKVKNNIFDGESVQNRDCIMNLDGNLRDILMIERTALDFMIKLSSIASSTAELIKIVHSENLNTTIAATRKVTPGFGYFEKKAIFLGGGDTHRWNLSDMVMFKDTHLNFFNGDISKLLSKAKKEISFSKKIEIEIEKPKDIRVAVDAGADIIMLDNMNPDQIRKALDSINDIKKKNVLFEASGNITRENILDYAMSGIDIISTSETILHPNKKMDFSLKLI